MIQSFSPWTTERHVGYVTACFHKGCRSNDSYIPKIEVCHWISRCLLRRILRHTRKGEQRLATTTESVTHSLKETASTSAVHFHLWLISILYMKKHRIPLFVLLLCTILFFVFRHKSNCAATKQGSESCRNPHDMKLKNYCVSKKIWKSKRWHSVSKPTFSPVRHCATMRAWSRRVVVLVSLRRRKAPPTRHAALITRPLTMPPPLLPPPLLLLLLLLWLWAPSLPSKLTGLLMLLLEKLLAGIVPVSSTTPAIFFTSANQPPPILLLVLTKRPLLLVLVLLLVLLLLLPLLLMLLLCTNKDNTGLLQGIPGRERKKKIYFSRISEMGYSNTKSGCCFWCCKLQAPQ